MANWNVRGLNGKENELIIEFERSKAALMIITETKKKGKGMEILNGGHGLWYSGVKIEERAQAGVAILVNKKFNNKVEEWNYISERIITVQIKITGNEKLLIVGCYGPSENEHKEVKEEFWAKLQVITENSIVKTLIIGDMNSRVGYKKDSTILALGKYGEEKTNNNGKRLIDFCVVNDMIITNTFFEHKNIHKYTRVNENKGENSIIDLFITERKCLKYFKDVKVKRSFEIDSDHYLVIAKLKIPKAVIIEKKGKKNSSNKKKNNNRIEDRIINSNIKSYKLKEEEVKRKFSDEINIELGKSSGVLENKDINEIWNIFKKVTLAVSARICGTNKKNGSKHQTPWWNDEVKKEVKEKKKIWAKYLSTRNERDYQEYKNQRSKVKNIVRLEKNKSWEIFGHKMEKWGEGNGKMLYRILKTARKEKQKQILWIKGKDGNLLKEEEEIKKRWKEYFSELLGERIEIENKDKYNEKFTEEIREEKIKDITLDEIKVYIKKLKYGKAAGIDNIKPEMLKAMENEGIQWLHEIINMIWKNGKLPEDWQTAIILPIPKKGDMFKCENYRGISLLSIPFKIYERALEVRLRKHIEETLEESQAGFRPGRSCQDWIFSLRQILEKINNRDKQIFICAIDMEKAFDTIKREKIWEVLEKRSVPTELILAIRNIYKTTKNLVRCKSIDTDEFITHKGVRQGSILSPLLFIIVLDEITKSLGPKIKGYHLGYRNLKPIIIKEFIYADDLILFAQSTKKLQENLDMWHSELNKYGMKINVKKTEVMTLGKISKNINMQLEGNQIKHTKSIKYLGAIINENGDLSEELNNRIQKTNTIYNSLRTLLFSKKEIAKHTKVKIYKTVLIPALIYGCESWTQTKEMQRKIETCEMKTLRRIEGVTKMDKIRSTIIRQRLKIESVKKTIEKRQLSWLGHLIRMDENKIAKLIWKTNIPGKKQRGRPKRNWNESIEEIVQERGMDIKNATLLATDRNKWKKWIANSQT
ncbi:MAG: reverse transcriptase domain-containing protein [Brevinema sp.]